MSLGVSISNVEGKSKPLACSQGRHILPCVDEKQAEGMLYQISLPLNKSFFEPALWTDMMNDLRQNAQSN